LPLKDSPEVVSQGWQYVPNPFLLTVLCENDETLLIRTEYNKKLSRSERRTSPGKCSQANICISIHPTIHISLWISPTSSQKIDRVIS
jgi:hypothetical protein